MTVFEIITTTLIVLLVLCFIFYLTWPFIREKIRHSLVEQINDLNDQINTLRKLKNDFKRNGWDDEAEKMREAIEIQIIERQKLRNMLSRLG